MGQSQVSSNTLQRPDSLRPTGAPKVFTITFRDWNCSLQVEDDTLTCGWLLSEVLRRYKASIIALTTRRNIEILDYWLTRMDRSLQPLADGEILEPVFPCTSYAAEVSEDMSKSHFEPIKLIGRGGFSRVIEARKKDTGQLYALKLMSKSFIIKEDKVRQILTERKVLANTQHPFIVHLHWAFQSVIARQRSELCLVMDFCPGGELFFHLHNLGRLTESQALFYFCEILLALEHLHGLGIVYRDLKPENVLLDVDGHVKLTDFGLSKEAMRKDSVAFSFCGSPEYMSPEMLLEAGHGVAVDYYSLGALLYEMVTGLPPFYDRNRERMYHAILHDTLPLPNYLSKTCRGLLTGLLEKNPVNRLGKLHGFAEIKSHPWLEKVDWERVLRRKKSPPFIPNLRMSNFDPEYTSAPMDFHGSSIRPLTNPFEGFEFDSGNTIDEHSPVYLFPLSHSKSASEMSTVSSESKVYSQISQGVLPVINEEEEHHVSMEMEISLIRAETMVGKKIREKQGFGREKKMGNMAKKLLPVVPDESITARFWEDGLEEDSIVREIR